MVINLLYQNNVQLISPLSCIVADSESEIDLSNLIHEQDAVGKHLLIPEFLSGKTKMNVKLMIYSGVERNTSEAILDLIDKYIHV